MAVELFTNRAYSTVANNPLAAGGTTLNLATGHGARFASPTGGDYQKLVLVSDLTDFGAAYEIVKVTARSTDALTIVRAQDGTSAAEWPAGTIVAGVGTAGTLDRLPFWELVVEESGVSFANFTIIDGSWASDGTTINFAGDGANRRSCRFTARVPHSTIYLWEAECMVPAAPGGSGEVGLSAQMATTWGANANSKLAHNGTTGTTVDTDTGAVANRETTTLAWGAFDEWHKLSMLVNVAGAEVFVDGTWVHGSLVAADIGAAPTPKLYVGLAAIRPAKYRNIKLWRFALPRWS